MVTTAKTRIDIHPPLRTREARASEVILPGHVVEYVSSGKFRKNDRAGDVRVLPMIALQKEYEGQGLFAGTHGTYSYAIDDQVVAGIFLSGSEVVLRVPASASAIVIGDILTTTSDGCVIKAANAANIPIAVALEALDNSGGATEVYIKALIV